MSTAIRKIAGLMLVESRRYRRALDAFLRNSGTLAQVRAATACSRPDIDRLLRGGFSFVTGGKAAKIESLLPPRERAWVQQSPRWPVMVGHVPTALIAPVISEAFDRYGRTATAQMTGYAERQLFGIVMERSGVRFELADAIVTRLVGPDWWLEGEARRWYWADVFGKQSEQQRQRFSLRRREQRTLVAA